MTKRKQPTEFVDLTKDKEGIKSINEGECTLEPTMENMDSLFRSWKAASALVSEGDAQSMEQQGEILELKKTKHELSCQAKANRKKLNTLNEANSDLTGQLNNTRIAHADTCQELKVAKLTLLDCEITTQEAEDIKAEFENSPEGHYRRQRDEMMEELDAALSCRMKDLRQTKWLLEQCLEEGAGDAASRIVDFLLKITFELGRYECWLDHVVSQDIEKRGLVAWYKLGLRSPLANI